MGPLKVLGQLTVTFGRQTRIHLFDVLNGRRCVEKDAAETTIAANAFSETKSDPLPPIRWYGDPTEIHLA